LIIKNEHIGQVIYVHPYHFRMFYRSTIPISLPAIINRIPYPVQGYFPEELNHEIIKNAQLVIIDIHWNYALHGAKMLVKLLRSVNANLKIIAGGYTASMFPEKLTSDFDIDFVIRGDGEIPLPSLVSALMDTPSQLDQVSNLIGKDGFKTAWNYRLTKQDLDKNEFYDLSFFPSYQLDVRKVHKRNFGWPAYIFPYLMAFRGCPLPCPTCAGSVEEQKKLFKRGPIIRSADRLG